MTAVLLNAGLTANQVTWASLATGLCGAWFFLQGSKANAVIGAVLFVVSYVLDACDGEIARLTGTASRRGDRFDSTSDWLIHSALFLALGTAQSRAVGDSIWLWCGCAAALGVTINYLVDWLANAPPAAAEHRPSDQTATVTPADLDGPPSWIDWSVFVLRHLMQRDFCFMLFAFVLTDTIWLLLISGAIGLQVYWMAGLYRRGRSFHA